MTPAGWSNSESQTGFGQPYYPESKYTQTQTIFTYSATIYNNATWFTPGIGNVSYSTPHRGYAKDANTPRARATVRAFQQPLELSILPPHPLLMLDTSMKVVRWNRRCLGASRPRASHRRRQRPEGWIGR